MESRPTIAAVPARKRVSPLLWLLGLLIVAGLGWSGFWAFAASQTGQALEAWVAREKTFGRIWSCPNPKIGGYPTAIAITCPSPRFDGLIFGHTYSGTLQGFYVTAPLMQPRDISVSADSPFAAVSKDDKVNFQLAWSHLNVRLNGLPQDLWQAAVDGRDFVLHGGAGALAFGGKVNDAVITAAQRAGQDGQTLDFNVILNGATLPAIDQILGPGTPADVAAQGSVTKADFETGLTPGQNLDRWQAAGGRVTLASVSLTRGDTKFVARGSFALNAAHRVDGHFDTKSSGLEPVMQHYGIDPGLLSFGALLGNLLSGHSNEPQQPTVLHLPVDIDDGRIAVGPIRTSLKLPPAY
ncbi:DUF2125 domain-containing protein [uncultured Methylovirgula sp.]|uniref:DUF2125 domain-containing protein n=1 Tax=uncultured Methylovirgula sp. TaxID=1285960 RepID=UPI00263A17DB|nr:DUF2125 domain-containing protein [uncultured Methylovirgula sp.]